MRLDSETTKDLTAEVEEALLKKVEAYIVTEKPQAIVLEDYNKGVLTERVIKAVIALCKQHAVITTVSIPNARTFSAYAGVDIFKPNMKERGEGRPEPVAGGGEHGFLNGYPPAVAGKTTES